MHCENLRLAIKTLPTTYNTNLIDYRLTNIHILTIIDI